MTYHSGDDIPISQMRAAHLVAKYGSLQKAGEDLNLGRSAVWSRIKALEQIVGFRLFKQSADQRIMEPTSQGAEFLSFCTPFVTSYETILAKYVSRPNEYGKRDTIVASTPNCFVPAAVFATAPCKHGGRLLEGGFREVIDAVCRKSANFGVIEVPSQNVGIIKGTTQANGLKVQVLHRTERRALLRKDNAALASPSFRLKLNENELCRNAQVCYYDPDLPDMVRDESFASHRENVLEVSSFAAAMAAIELRDCYLVGCGYCDEIYLRDFVAVPLLPKDEVLVLGVENPENGCSQGSQELQKAIVDELSSLKLRRDVNLDRWFAKREALRAAQERAESALPQG